MSLDIRVSNTRTINKKSGLVSVRSATCSFPSSPDSHLLFNSCHSSIQRGRMPLFRAVPGKYPYISGPVYAG